jgi:hypothetical protein
MDWKSLFQWVVIVIMFCGIAYMFRVIVHDFKQLFK